MLRLLLWWEAGSRGTLYHLRKADVWLHLLSWNHSSCCTWCWPNGKESLKNLSPTKVVLIQHTKRALLQASFYWNKSATVQQEIPEFSTWGWYRDSTSKTWEPYWTTLADASKACTILLHCGCKKSCRGRCKCSKAGVCCTSICACEGACTNNDGGDDEWSSNCVHVRDTMTTRIHERDHETKPAVFHVVAFFVMLSNPSFNSFGLFGFIIL